MKRINILKQNLEIKKNSLCRDTQYYSQILKVFPPFYFRSFEKKAKKNKNIIYGNRKKGEAAAIRQQENQS